MTFGNFVLFYQNIIFLYQTFYFSLLLYLKYSAALCPFALSILYLFSLRSYDLNYFSLSCLLSHK